MNPFATGIASGFAGHLDQRGDRRRLVILVIGTIIGIVFVMRYAAKVKADPVSRSSTTRRPPTRPSSDRRPRQPAPARLR